jgi:hypothetical protein
VHRFGLYFKGDHGDWGAGPAPEGFPGDLPPPEPLLVADAKDASDLSGVLQEYLIRCLFSKNWQLREAALQHIAMQLSGEVRSCNACIICEGRNAGNTAELNRLSFLVPASTACACLQPSLNRVSDSTARIELCTLPTFCHPMSDAKIHGGGQCYL